MEKFNSAHGFSKEVIQGIVLFIHSMMNENLTYSRHALERMNTNDRSHGVNPADIPNFNGKMLMPKTGWNIVEVECENGKVAKILFRKELNSEEDVCMPIVSHNGKPFVKTIWKNRKDDNHATLRSESISKGNNCKALIKA